MSDKAIVYEFTQGIPGFEHYWKFRFVEEQDAPFARLSALEEEKIGFVLIRPGLLFPDYGVEVDAESEGVLNLHSESETHKEKIEIWAIVTLDRQNVARSTVNLRAPILLNTEDKLGIQLITADERYLTRHPIVPDKPLAQEGAVG